uniref:IBB domain-containing protein n=1 Tax=Salix viminalis TaxID=40686 RepID=A0A6N2MF26_SALVM
MRMRDGGGERITWWRSVRDLQKKRREGLQSQAMPASLHSSAAEKKQLEHLPSMVAGVWSEDGSLQLEATTQFRKLLSVGEKLLLGVYVIIVFYFFLILERDLILVDV